ncbi:MAG: hypothetical protein E7244_01810 [Enterocloster citroniae]|nr:hypothetical protein [Enterocloster citroniae]
MPKFIDKMNLPQYRYFNDMIQRKEEHKNMIADAMAGSHTMKSGSKKDRIEGLLLFGKAVRHMPEFLYRLEEDQKRCRNFLSVTDKRKQEKRLEHYLNILLMLPYFQGQPIVREQPVSDELQKVLSEGPPSSKYKLDRTTGRYYLPYSSVPKLLLVSEELFREKQEQLFTEKEKESLEQLLTRDVHYIICVQGGSQAETAYLVERDADLVIRTLDRKKCSDQIQVPHLTYVQDDMTAVLLCLRDYLLEIKLAEEQRRKYNEGHPDTARRRPKEEIIPQYMDKNAIRVFDLNDRCNGNGFDGGVFFLGRHGGSTCRKTGYEMSPHTRKGHYRTYKDGRTVYVRSSVIHKEKYEGIQSAHRINQEPYALEELEDNQEPDNGFSMGMVMK